MRSETVVQNAQGVVGYRGMTLRVKGMVQKLDWPANVAAHDEKASLNEGVLEETFRRLRDDFASVRENKGLLDGVQRNVILVINRYTVDSVLGGSGNVDEMWVWALDPDHTPTPRENEPRKVARTKVICGQGYSKLPIISLICGIFRKQSIPWKTYGEQRREAGRGYLSL